MNVEIPVQEREYVELQSNSRVGSDRLAIVVEYLVKIESRTKGVPVRLEHVKKILLPSMIVQVSDLSALMPNNCLKDFFVEVPPAHQSHESVPKRMKNQ